MELRHLRYFVAVAELLSFRRAAERLHMAQPPLSAQIKALENELGARLFNRTTRNVKLTHAGQILFVEARTLLASAMEAERRVKEADQGLVGTIRLGVIAPAANAWLAGVLRSFRRKFRGVQLSVFDLTSPEQLRRLRINELDVGLLRPPVGEQDLDCIFVEESEQVLALPAGHRLAKKRSLEWVDFHDEELVLVHPIAQHGYYDAFLAACAKAGAKPRPAQYAHDIQTKMWLISAGFGIAPTTATLRRIKRPGLVFRALPSGLPLVKTVLVWRKHDDSPVLEHFRSCFQPLPEKGKSSPV
ncbi:MAG TPA: LysR substrate-binding domain-containing protein [Candidatus Saccharimonadales bacterium]|nr:LysR substrate-binding domain-containing protein [Candidatus Saccharimonadales bacterium]